MPYNKWEDVNPAITGIKPKVSLAQANAIARCADKATGAKNPWAACISSFKKSHQLNPEGTAWVKIKKEIKEDMNSLTPIILCHGDFVIWPKGKAFDLQEGQTAYIVSKDFLNVWQESVILVKGCLSDEAVAKLELLYEDKTISPTTRLPQDTEPIADLVFIPSAAVETQLVIPTIRMSGRILRSHEETAEDEKIRIIDSFEVLSVGLV